MGLPDGRYTLEIRVETSTLLYNNITVLEDIFVIYTPGFFTPGVNLLVLNFYNF